MSTDEPLEDLSAVSEEECGGSQGWGHVSPSFQTKKRAKSDLVGWDTTSADRLSVKYSDTKPKRELRHTHTAR